MTDELKQWEYDKGYERGKADMLKVIKRLRKRISDLYNTDVTYDNGDYNTMDTPTLDKVLEYFDSEVSNGEL